jgi:Zn-dependent peptidase ImmA (M78 family)
MFACVRRPGIQYEEAVDHVCNLTKVQVDQYAAEAAKLLGFKPGDDVFALVENLGGRVHFTNLFDSSGDADTIFVHGQGDFDILLSSASSPFRDRFTVAHELGHYLLHSQQGAMPLVAARTGTNRAEWEANWFAAGFLMPEQEFRTAHSADSRAFKLAGVFAVSEAAVEVRKKVLELA